MAAKKKRLTGAAFGRRVDALYLRHHPDREGPHGSLAWYGRVVGVAPRAAWAWTSREFVRPAVVRELEIVEAFPNGSPDILRWGGAK